MTDKVAEGSKSVSIKNDDNIHISTNNKKAIIYTYTVEGTMGNYSYSTIDFQATIPK